MAEALPVLTVLTNRDFFDFIPGVIASLNPVFFLMPGAGEPIPQ